MKEIEYYIKSNNKLMEEWEKELNKTKVESEKLRIKNNIDKAYYYIKGLKDAKKFIEDEEKAKNEER